MEVGRIRSFHNQLPARPFTIHTASGESYPVRNPEAMAIGEVDGIVILLPGPGKLAMIDMASITEITQGLE